MYLLLRIVMFHCHVCFRGREPPGMDPNLKDGPLQLLLHGVKKISPVNSRRYVGFTRINGVLCVYLQLVGYLEDHPNSVSNSVPPLCLYALATETLVMKTTEPILHSPGSHRIQVFHNDINEGSTPTESNHPNHRGTRHRWHEPRNLRSIFLQFVLLVFAGVLRFVFFSKVPIP